jgi:hypothetical protein
MSVPGYCPVIVEDKHESATLIPMKHKMNDCSFDSSLESIVIHSSRTYAEFAMSDGYFQEKNLIIRDLF